jgi:PTS system fructose-specific IIC component/PTS system nitrogen regulatory IIA component
MREAKMSTGIVHGVAVPHGLCSSLKGVTGGIGISSGGLEFSSLDNAPVYVVFMLLSNPNHREQSIRVLSELASLFNSANFVSDVLARHSMEDLYSKFEGVIL